MNVMRSVMCVAMVASFLSAQTSLLEGRSLDDWSSESGGWEWLGDALRGDIPGLGNLFKSTQRINNKSELLIFVTPKILEEGSFISP